jgi:Arc-like DNA binding domain
VARRLSDTVKLQVRLSERLRRRLEQAAKHERWSMNTEIVSRLDASFSREELDKHMGSAIEQAALGTATRLGGVIEQAVHDTVTRLVQELRQSGVIPEQNAQPLEATKHLARPDKEEHSK